MGWQVFGLRSSKSYDVLHPCYISASLALTCHSSPLGQCLLVSFCVIVCLPGCSLYEDVRQVLLQLRQVENCSTGKKQAVIHHSRITSLLGSSSSAVVKFDQCLPSVLDYVCKSFKYLRSYPRSHLHSSYLACAYTK